MQAKQRTQGADPDAAPESRLEASEKIKYAARVAGCVLIADFLLCASAILSARIAGAGSALLFSCLLLAASLWDIRRRVIPDTICAAIAALGLLSFVPDKLLGVLPVLLLLIAALLVKGGMGGGDIKLTAASGFVMGLPAVSAGIILGMAAALLYYLPLHAIRKLKKDQGQPVKQTALPLVPFLSIGFISVTIMGLLGGISV